MAKIKNTSGEDRIVPWLGGRLVVAGAVVEVEVDQVTAFTQQEATWAPADKQAETLHNQMLEGIAALLAPEDEADEDGSSETPRRTSRRSAEPGNDDNEES